MNCGYFYAPYLPLIDAIPPIRTPSPVPELSFIDLVNTIPIEWLDDFDICEETEKVNWKKLGF